MYDPAMAGHEAWGTRNNVEAAGGGELFAPLLWKDSHHK